MTLEQVRTKFNKNGNMFDYTSLVNDKAELLLTEAILGDHIAECEKKIEEAEKKHYHFTEMISKRDNLIFEIMFVRAVLEIVKNGETQITLEQILEKEKKNRVEDGMFGIKECKRHIQWNLDMAKKYPDHFKGSLYLLLEEYVERANVESGFNWGMVLACWEMINNK